MFLLLLLLQSPFLSPPSASLTITRRTMSGGNNPVATPYTGARGPQYATITSTSREEYKNNGNIRKSVSNNDVENGWGRTPAHNMVRCFFLFVLFCYIILFKLNMIFYF